MRIKRTFATTMREALAQVKLEQGPDAVILGNKKVAGGVEIISAIDFDQASVDGFETESVAAKSVAQPVTQNTDIASDTWVGSLLTESENGRTEPTLGPVAQAPKKVERQPVQQIAQQPAWLEQAFAQAEKMPRPSSPQITPQQMTPQQVPRAIDLAPSPARKPLRRVKQASKPSMRSVNAAIPKKSPPPEPQEITNPIIDEVRHELKGLRDLMQSQLSVLQWDQFSQRHPVRTVLLSLMSELGLGTDICDMIFSHLDELNDDPHKVWQEALGVLASCIPVSRHDLLADGGRIALVGSTGVGKTTTIAKLAARFVHIHGKRSIGMISTDHFRIGAQEQLQHFARLLEIPLLTANKSEELADRLEMFADKKMVLIDTAGMSQHDLRLSERFHKMQDSAPQIKPYLVLSANTQLAALNQTIKSFSKVQLAGAFVTKLDEAASLGGVITASIRHQLALTYCGTGQKVPEDLEAAKKHRLVSKAVSMMQNYAETQDQESLAVRYSQIINKNKV